MYAPLKVVIEMVVNAEVLTSKEVKVHFFLSSF